MEIPFSYLLAFLAPSNPVVQNFTRHVERAESRRNWLELCAEFDYPDRKVGEKRETKAPKNTGRFRFAPRFAYDRKEAPICSCKGVELNFPNFNLIDDVYVYWQWMPAIYMWLFNWRYYGLILIISRMKRLNAIDIENRIITGLTRESHRRSYIAKLRRDGNEQAADFYTFMRD